MFGWHWRVFFLAVFQLNCVSHSFLSCNSLDKLHRISFVENNKEWFRQPCDDVSQLLVKCTRSWFCRLHGSSNDCDNNDDEDNDIETILWPNNSRDNNLSDPSLIMNGMNEQEKTTRIRQSQLGPQQGSPPNKGDLYSNEELSNLLKVHQEFFPALRRQQQQQQDDNDASRNLNQEEDSPFSLHELVQQTIAKVDDVVKVEDSIGIEEDQINSNGEALEGKNDEENNGNMGQVAATNVRAIATDVDGTLLTSSHTLHPRTEKAIRRVIEQMSSLSSRSKKSNDDSSSSKLQYIFPATGKTRVATLSGFDRNPEMKELFSRFPGVFVQGLYCVDGEGNVVFEKKLSLEAIGEAEQLAAKENVTIIGYDGDVLFTNNRANDDVISHITNYKEPMPMKIGDSLLNHREGMHKLLLIDFDTKKISSVLRPKLQDLVSIAAEKGYYNATLTVAIPTMLEVLPAGCSKGLGVAKLCDALGIDPSTELLALGDAENDVDMLELAAIGVAMKNACPLAKKAANFVTNESNNDGGAGAAIEKFGLKEGP